MATNSQTQPITSKFNSSLLISFVKEVEEMQRAKQTFFSVSKSGLQTEKNEALKDLKQKESKVETSLFKIKQAIPQLEFDLAESMAGEYLIN